MAAGYVFVEKRDGNSPARKELYWSDNGALDGNLTPVSRVDGATGGSAGSSVDRELVVTTYQVKTAFTGASVGDTITATRVLDVSGTTASQVGSTIWRNETTGSDLASAPNAANLNLTGMPGLTDAQLRASAVNVRFNNTSLDVGTITNPLPTGANTIGAILNASFGSMGWDGTTWQRIAANNAGQIQALPVYNSFSASDGFGNGGMASGVSITGGPANRAQLTSNMVFNGTSWDRQRDTSTVSGTTGTGLAAAGVLGWDGASYQRLKVDNAGTIQTNEQDCAAVSNTPGTALNAILFSADTNGYNGLWFQLIGVGVGTIVVESSLDNVNWVTAFFQSPSQVLTSSMAATGAWSYGGGHRYVRARVSSYTSGTFTSVSVLRKNIPPAPGGVNINAGNTIAVSATSASTGANLTYRLNSAATVNATAVKTSAGKIMGGSISNTTANTIYLRFFNKASAPVAGDTPVMVIPVLANETRSIGDLVACPIGMFFSLGISFNITAALPDTDATAITASAAMLTILYI